MHPRQFLAYVLNELLLVLVQLGISACAGHDDLVGARVAQDLDETVDVLQWIAAQVVGSLHQLVANAEWAALIARAREEDVSKLKR